MTTPPREDLAKPVRITRDAIYIGDDKIPGHIADDGITLYRGGDINRLQITLLVGQVTADDPHVTATKVTERQVTEAIHYQTKPTVPKT